jgi:hypothetical protein
MKWTSCIAATCSRSSIFLKVLYEIIEFMLDLIADERVGLLVAEREALVSLDAEEFVSLYEYDFVLEDTSSGNTITNKNEL